MAIRIILEPTAPKPINRREFLKAFQETHQYDKNVHDAQQRQELRRSGFHPVVSSFVSAFGAQGDDLYVRYVDGKVFKYIGQAYLLDDALSAGSHGQFVWKNLFRKNIKGLEVGTLPLETGTSRMLELEDSGIAQDTLFDTRQETAMQPMQPKPIKVAPIKVASVRRPKPIVISVLAILALQELLKTQNENSDEKKNTA